MATKTATKTTKRVAPSKTLEAQILKLLSGGPRPKVAALATVNEEGAPAIRPMSLHADGLTLYSATMLDSRKVAHIRHNPNVALTTSADPSDLASPYVVISARAEILTDRRTRKARWSKHLEMYFDGLDDPNYCVLRYTPVTIEYWNDKGLQVLTPKKRAAR
jgi:general stress protein 26